MKVSTKSIMKKAIILCSALLESAMLVGCYSRKSPYKIQKSRLLPHHFKQLSSNQIKNINLKDEFHQYALYSPSFHKILIHDFIGKNHKLTADTGENNGEEPNNSDGYSYSAISLHNPVVNGELDASKTMMTKHSDVAYSGNLNYYTLLQFDSNKQDGNIGYEVILDSPTKHTLTLKSSTYLSPVQSIKYQLDNVKENKNGQKKLYLKPIKIKERHLKGYKVYNHLIKKHDLLLTENGKFVKHGDNY